MFKFLEAVLMLSGMIIGAGMFAIPFSFVRAGFWIGAAELVVLGIAVLAIHLVYGEVVMSTASRHRLPGLAKLYLGRSASLLAWGAALFGMTGALVAYIILGTLFIRELLPSFLSGAGDGVLAAIFVAIGALIGSLSLRKEALINGVLTAILIGFILFLSLSLVPQISASNLAPMHPREFFFPYGVLLFALTGATAVPELIPLLGSRRNKVRLAIIAGSLIPVFVYFLFALGVVGAAGEFVSKEAVHGLRLVAGDGVVKIGSLIGLLAVFTSFVVLSTALQSLLTLDLGMRRRGARVFSIIVPFAFYMFGFQDFISVISVVGAVAVGIDTVLIVAMYKRMREQHGAEISWGWRMAQKCAYVVVSAGVIAQFFIHD